MLNVMNLKKIGKLIKDARKKSQLTQKQVAYKVGLSRATIVAVEQGKTVPRYDKMVRLSKLLSLEG